MSLSNNNDIYTSDNIKSYINKYKENIRIEMVETADSTNNLAKKLAENGDLEGKVVIARQQTMGKGRMGRSFYSPSETGIYMSIILRPKLHARDAGLITVAAAVSTSLAIENITGLKTQIKWVNDVFYNGHKIVGILAEAYYMNNDSLDYVILGIGVNVYKPVKGFPQEIDNVAGGILEQDSDNGVIKSKIAADIINVFFDYYDQLADKKYMKEYKDRSLLIGKEINIISGTNTRSAMAIDIDDEGRLVVKTDNNEIETLFSGEVSVRLK